MRDVTAFAGRRVGGRLSATEAIKGHLPEA